MKTIMIASEASAKSGKFGGGKHSFSIDDAMENAAAFAFAAGVFCTAFYIFATYF